MCCAIRLHYFATLANFLFSFSHLSSARPIFKTKLFLLLSISNIEFSPSSSSYSIYYCKPNGNFSKLRHFYFCVGCSMFKVKSVFFLFFSILFFQNSYIIFIYLVRDKIRNFLKIYFYSLLISQ